MTDGMSAIARDQERYAAHAQLRFAVRKYILRGFTKKLHGEVLKLASVADDVHGKGYFSAQTMNTESRLSRELAALKEKDTKAWGNLIAAWNEENSSFYSLDLSPADSRLRDQFCDDKGYRAFRALAPFDPEALAFTFDTRGDDLYKVCPELFRRTFEELKRLGWRTSADRTTDRYLLLLNKKLNIKIVWLGAGWLDATNFGRGVFEGPERFRCVKKSA